LLFVNTYIINILSQTIRHRYSPHEDPVVLVGRLGQAHNARLFGDSLSEIFNDEITGLTFNM